MKRFNYICGHALLLSAVLSILFWNAPGAIPVALICMALGAAMIISARSGDNGAVYF